MAYTEPTAATLKARYPAFASVSDATVNLWITDAARFVDTSWREADYTVAKMAYAAHMLSETGTLPSAIPAGVTSFKSGAFSATIADGLAGLTGFAASIYGREFLALRRASFAGPRLAWAPPAALDYY